MTQPRIYNLVIVQSLVGQDREASPPPNAQLSSKVLRSFQFRWSPVNKSRVDRMATMGTWLCKNEFLLNSINTSMMTTKKLTRNSTRFPSKLMQFAMARGFDAGFVLGLDGAHGDAVERELVTSGNVCESFCELP